jgi:hypothetical protein
MIIRTAVGLTILAVAAPAVAQESSAPGPQAPASAEPSPADRALLREIEAASAPVPSSANAPTAANGTGPASTGGSAAVSNIYNPAMSFNGLFLVNGSNRDGDRPRARLGLAVQELEIQLVANVDPYFAANVILTVPHGSGIELEEGYLTPSAEPLGLQARLGKIRAPFGRENAIHTHALPFIDKSLVGTAVFGEEGLSEVGGELSYLFPTPWYSLVTATVMSAENDAVFASPRPYDASGYAAWRNVLDVTDDATLDLGLAYALGNNAANELGQICGAHAVFKWRPARQARERELIIVAEGIYATRPNLPATSGTDQSVGGAYGYAQWRLTQWWYTAGRFDYLGYPNEARGIKRRGSVILVFAPSEFSALRAQASASRRPDVHRLVYEGFLQLDFTLGAHPAHAY